MTLVAKPSLSAVSKQTGPPLSPSDVLQFTGSLVGGTGAFDHECGPACFRMLHHRRGLAQDCGGRFFRHTNIKFLFVSSFA